MSRTARRYSAKMENGSLPVCLLLAESGACPLSRFTPPNPLDFPDVWRGRYGRTKWCRPERAKWNGRHFSPRSAQQFTARLDRVGVERGFSKYIIPSAIKI
uniref:Putative secreted protein n=1 Tax=Ixodes ricinus TaxID=34613 RepID=A0A6B0U6R1_IXORI